MYLLAPFILNFFLKFLKLIQSSEDVPFSGPKWPTCPEQFFFGTNHYFYFHLPIGPFHCAEFKKLLQQIQCYEDVPFLRQKWSTCSNFFLKIINIILIYQLALFTVQKFKKILPVDPELWGCTIFGSKMAHFPKWEFFRKPVNESCFFHLCFSTCQKSKSDINVLVKYWRLKSAEILLVKSNFWL